MVQNQIPLIPALEKDGGKMQCLEGQYYYLFAWSDGKALGWHEIEEKHCRIMGKILAKIHRIQWLDEQEILEGQGALEGQEARKESAGTEPEGLFDIDWDAYSTQAKQRCPEIAGELEENRELLYLAQREYNNAIKSVPAARCICDGDMDCKNVLWENGKPFVIDLECLDYGNPFTELFQLALSWAGGAVCDVDFQRFRGFVEAYQSEYGKISSYFWQEKISVDWETLSGMGYSWLDWLAYNVRRALGLECGNEEERTLGIREAQETIRRIRYYHSIREELVRYLQENW